jgi:uncharacterized membrane protein
MPGGSTDKSFRRMRKILTSLIALLLVFIVPAGARAASDTEQAVVHAVLFWSSGCSYCEQTLTSVLPSIQDKYQSQLNIQLVELASSKDVDALYAFGEALGLAKEKIAVPFMLIDQNVLVGVDEIRNKLPGLIDSYLANGGVGYMDSPILNEMLQKGVDYATSDRYLHLATPATTQANAAGMTLAWVVMVLMWLALIFAIVMLVRAFQGKELGSLNSVVDFVLPILCLIGLGASIYLTYVEITHTRALCGPVGDCNTVQSSPYAKLFGFLPIALVGAIGYVAILAAWLWRHFRQDTLSKMASPAMYAMALFGTFFSIYLTYLELLVIHAVCIWCLASAIIITALMLLCLPPVTQWLAISDEED